MSNTEERIIHMDYSELAKRETIKDKILDRLALEDWPAKTQVEIGVSLHNLSADGNHSFYITCDPILGRMNQKEKVRIGSFQKQIFSEPYSLALLEHTDFQQDLINAAKESEARKA